MSRTVVAGDGTAVRCPEGDHGGEALLHTRTPFVGRLLRGRHRETPFLSGILDSADIAGASSTSKPGTRCRRPRRCGGERAGSSRCMPSARVLTLTRKRVILEHGRKAGMLLAIIRPSKEKPALDLRRLLSTATESPEI